MEEDKFEEREKERQVNAEERSTVDDPRRNCQTIENSH
jgi:hypothetical protein